MNQSVFSYLKRIPLANSFLSLADESYRHELENQVAAACDQAGQSKIGREQIAGDIAYFEEMLSLPTTNEIESATPSQEKEIFQDRLEERYRALRALDECERLTKDYQNKYPE